MRAISDAIDRILGYAQSGSLKSGQTFINTARIYDATLRFFAIESSSPAYSKINAEIKSIIGKYNIDSKRFNAAYENIYPSTNQPLDKSTDVELSDDAMDVLNALSRNAQLEQRQQDVGDLLCQLFSNKNYALYFVFSKISDNFKTERETAENAGLDTSAMPMPYDVNILYADMNRLFVKSFVKEVKSLESEDMQKYLTNINKYVSERKDFKLIGMDREMTALEVALAGRTKKSAVLVGLAGTGKTSLVWELANRINNADDRLPENLKNKIIYELHLDAIVAGAQFRGQSEERLKNILDAVSKLKNVILFIDEFHTIVNNGGTGGDKSGGDSTSGNIIKPYLSRGDIQVIGATTVDEFNENVEKDKAITRRFKKVLVDEPTDEETLEIMRGVTPINNEFFSREMEDSLLPKILKLSKQYNLSSANPDKALTMTESAYAYAKICRAEGKDVTISDMLHEIELEFNLKMSETKAADTRKELHDVLLGQDDPLDQVSDYLDMIDMNVVDPNKPRCSLLLAGPTGTGKTETAKIIAKLFTGSDNNLITVAGNTLRGETAVSTLFGADAGYIGYKDTSDFLAQVKQKPNCVVLFDEIEKANPAVFKSLLGMLDEGYVADKAGNKISFRNAIILFTTNLGFGTTNHTGDGLMSARVSSGKAMLEIDKHFSPEFLARLDDVIVYNRLTPDIVNKLIERYRVKYAAQSETDVKFTKKQISEIREAADIESLGARVLDHAVKLAYYKALKASLKKGE